jgi:hypothetical protein
LLHTPSQQIYKSSAYFRHKASGDTYIEAMKDLDDKIGWVCLSSLRNRAEFTGELGETILLEPPKGAIPAKQLVVISLGDEKACRLAKTCRKNSGRRA